MYGAFHPNRLCVHLCAQVAFPAQVVIHDGFDGNPQNGFDIALIQLPEPSEQKPARVPRSVSKIKKGTVASTGVLPWWLRTFGSCIDERFVCRIHG